MFIRASAALQKEPNVTKTLASHDNRTTGALEVCRRALLCIIQHLKSYLCGLTLLVKTKFDELWETSVTLRFRRKE